MLKIAVCAKQVPDTDIPPSQFKVDEGALRVIPASWCPTHRQRFRYERCRGSVAVARRWS